MRTSENKNDGTKKPHPAPDPTQPGKGTPGTKIPVSPDEDNDFTKPSREIKEPENPSQTPVSDPQRQSIPGPDETPGNPGAQRNDPDIMPSKSGEAFISRSNKGLMLSLMLMFFVSFTSYADDKKLPAKEAVPVEVTVMMNRLDEIKAMDRSEMTSTEKKELRKEVRELKKKLADANGGIYLSAGAVVVIIILLILFL